LKPGILASLLQISGGHIEESASPTGMNVATVYRKIKKIRTALYQFPVGFSLSKENKLTAE